MSQRAQGLVEYGLIIALVAVLGETLTDILEPWPLKVVVDT